MEYAVTELHAVQPADVAPEAAAAAEAKLARPDWLPAKFETPEAMAKAYGELSKKLGEAKPTAADPAEKPAEEPVKAAEKPASEEAAPVTYGTAVDGVLAQAGIQPAELAAHWAEHKTITPEHYAAFEKAGYPRHVVDAYIRGNAAAAEQVGQAKAEAAAADAVFKEVGGEAEYKALARWAAENLTDAELEAYNAAVSGADPLMAVKGLMAKRAGPKLKFGGAGAAQAQPGFGSMQEQMAAYAKARKSGDPELMAAYERKALRSRFE